MIPTIERQYNETTAIFLAYMTSVSYCEAQHIRNWSCSPCQVVPPLTSLHVVQDPSANFQGIIGFSKRYQSVIVAFRGSMDVKNWLDNLTFLKTRAYKEFPQAKVHQGFYWVYRSVATALMPIVRSLVKKHRGAPLLVTGHSLGAAVAVICAFELQLLENVSVHALHTFGEPRVGNANFSGLLNSSIPEVYRVTHFRDAVPHLPPTWVGFQHGPREVRFR